MLADEIYKLMGVERGKPLAEQINEIEPPAISSLQTKVGTSMPESAPLKQTAKGKDSPGLDVIATPDPVSLSDVPKAPSTEKTLLERVQTMDFANEWRVSDTRTPMVDTMLEAIAHNETGIVKGNKYAFNKIADPENPKNRDNGKYQVTTDELKTYSKRFLGRAVKDKEFLASPKLQEEYMRNKINFMMNEGLTPGEILASHRGGLPNWGDPVKMNEKREAYPDYIKEGTEKYLTDLQKKDAGAYAAQLEIYKKKIAK